MTTARRKLAESPGDDGEAIGGRILIVDDDAELADNLAEIITLAGYEAIRAPSAEDALDEVASGSVDVIMTDDFLRGMSGAGLLSKLRPRRSGAPIVLITARPADEGNQVAPDGHVTRFVCRTIDVPRLLSSLGALLADRGAGSRRRASPRRRV